MGSRRRPRKQRSAPSSLGESLRGIARAAGAEILTGVLIATSALVVTTTSWLIRNSVETSLGRIAVATAYEDPTSFSEFEAPLEQEEKAEAIPDPKQSDATIQGNEAALAEIAAAIEATRGPDLTDALYAAEQGPLEEFDSEMLDKVSTTIAAYEQFMKAAIRKHNFEVTGLDPDVCTVLPQQVRLMKVQLGTICEHLAVELIETDAEADPAQNLLDQFTDEFLFEAEGSEDMTREEFQDLYDYMSAREQLFNVLTAAELGAPQEGGALKIGPLVHALNSLNQDQIMKSIELFSDPFLHLLLSQLGFYGFVDGVANEPNYEFLLQLLQVVLES